MLIRSLILASTTLLACLYNPAAAQWLQFGGPRRDFSCEPAVLNLNWPRQGLRPMWSRPLGDGYSSVVVEGKLLFTHFREGDDEIVICMSTQTGQTMWTHRYPEPIDTARFASRYGYGPRATPLVAGDRIFAVGFNARLVCLDKRNGRLLWSLDLLRRFNAAPTRWGYANSPIASGKSIIIPVGGQGAALVALNQESGAVEWQRHNFENSYGSPMLIEVYGQLQLVCLMAREVVAVDPSNGDLLWRHSHEGQWLNNIPNPVWGPDNILLVTSEGDAGTRALQLSTDNSTVPVQQLWHSRKFRVVHRNVVRIDDVAYGSSGDFGATAFSAIHVPTGKILWQDRNIARAGILRVGERLLLLEETGQLLLATPQADRITIHARSQILSDPAWTIPTLINDTLYLRDRKTIMAVALP